jgi:hypothetical protein
MAVSRDITATYRRPQAVYSRLLARGPREDLGLVYLMAGCVLLFIAHLPRLAREAHLGGQDLNMLMAGSLMALVFIAPLLFYGLALASYWILRGLRGRATGFGTRLALFWALLAVSPLTLLNGLVAGFIGAGPAQNSVAYLWFVAFVWFWGNGLWAAHRAGDV